MDATRLVLNTLWFVLHGSVLAPAYLLAGVVACLLVVTVPCRPRPGGDDLVAAGRRRPVG
jgi:hypothetical protein